MPTLSDVIKGIAVADAAGNPLEFQKSISLGAVAASLRHSELRVSDDTQMTLFCAEALFRAGSKVDTIEEQLKAAYLRWYRTQTRGATNCTDEGLLGFSSLYSVEAPGLTCMSACRALVSGRAVYNDSKGNGTVMRCAPIAFWAIKHSVPFETVMLVATMDAELTHKHPYAAECSRVLVSIYLRLLGGEDLTEATVNSVLQLYHAGAVSTEVSDLLLSSVNTDFVSFKQKTSKHRTLMSDGGWVAEEALALALCSVKNSNSYIEAISLAIAINGDSDTVGGIAGGLAVACGMPPHPKYVSKLNALCAIDFVGEHYQ